MGAHHDGLRALPSAEGKHLSQIFQYILNGISLGSIYAVVAIGFNLIYSTTGIINFAQGEFVMLGGMLSVTLSRYMELPFAIAISVIIVALFGALLEVSFFRRLRKHSILHLIIITIGLSIVVQEMALHIWDEKTVTLPYFTGDECTSILLLGASISPQKLWVLGTVAVMVAILFVFSKYTLLGQAMRACSANHDAAMLSGINTSNMRTLAFSLSAAMGAIAGCVVSPISQTSYDMGSGLAIKGFAAAILGGLGNPMGAVAGGLAVGLIEAFSVQLNLPAAYKDVSAFVVLIFVLFIRPNGLFGTRGPENVREC